MYCEICKKDILYKPNFFVRYHLKLQHSVDPKEYYDTFIRKCGEGICSVCNKETKFVSLSVGYKKYHKKCISKDKKIKEKVKNTNNNKSLEEEKIRIQKIKSTKLKKYGFSGYNNSEKRKQTCIDKYGVEHYVMTSQFSKKSKKTCIDKYGVENVSQLEFVKNKCVKTYNKNKKDGVYYNKLSHNRKIDLVNKILNENNFILLNYILNDKIHIKCNKCNNDITIRTHYLYLKNKNNREICPYCNDIFISSFEEKEVYNFIKENYKGVILKNNKNVIKPYEFDIYIPDLKLAFEFNGLYWHNELNKDKNYHLNKTILSEKNGIHLVHIYEDEWIYKNEIIKSRILNLLKVNNIKIYGRQCKVKEISYNLTKEFLNKNHLQGNVNSKIKLGLFYNNELVSLMIFGKQRISLGNKSDNGSYELLRFCNKLNINVIGSASKLYKYFIQKYSPQKVISYADRSWTMNNGNNIYDKLGFEFVNYTLPNYFYIIGDVRENRFKYRKDVLIRDGFDKLLTEREIMLQRGIYRIYNSGNLKYINTYMKGDNN